MIRSSRLGAAFMVLGSLAGCAESWPGTPPEDPGYRMVSPAAECRRSLGNVECWLPADQAAIPPNAVR